MSPSSVTLLAKPVSFLIVLTVHFGFLLPFCLFSTPPQKELLYPGALYPTVLSHPLDLVVRTPSTPSYLIVSTIWYVIASPLLYFGNE